MGDTKKKPAIYLKIEWEKENAHIRSCIQRASGEMKRKRFCFCFGREKILQNENMYAEMKVKNE